MDSISNSPTQFIDDKSANDVSIDEGVIDQRVVDHVMSEVSRAFSTFLNIDYNTNATNSIAVSIQSSGNVDDSNVSVRSFNGHSQYRNEGSGYGVVRRKPRRNNATAHRQFNGRSSNFSGQINVQYNSFVQPTMQFPPYNSHHHPRSFFYQPPMVTPPTRPLPVFPPLHDQYLYPSPAIHNSINFMNTPHGLTVPPNNSQFNYNMMHPSYNGRPFFPATTSNNMINRPQRSLPPPRPGSSVYSTYNHGGHGTFFGGNPNHHQFPRPINRMNDLSNEVMIRKQIEYYFCNENLAKDHYLKGLMDREGWVSVHLIALFPRIQAITKDIVWILKSLECSDFIELNGEYMRSRHNWSTWIINHPSPDKIDHQTTKSI